MSSGMSPAFSKKENVIIVGGGITGLCTAYYLLKNGYHSTVIDSGGITDGCSFGNMGFLSPSHFIPLAAPGIISEGIKHMLNNKSPFYIKPRVNLPFLRWGGVPDDLRPERHAHRARGADQRSILFQGQQGRHELRDSREQHAHPAHHFSAR